MTIVLIFINRVGDSLDIVKTYDFDAEIGAVCMKKGCRYPFDPNNPYDILKEEQ